MAVVLLSVHLLGQGRVQLASGQLAHLSVQLGHLLVVELLAGY